MGGAERKRFPYEGVIELVFLSGHLACALPDVSRRKEAYQKRASQTFKSLLPPPTTHTQVFKLFLRHTQAFEFAHKNTLFFRKLFLQSLKLSRNAKSL